MELRRNFLKNNPQRIFLATLLGAMLAVGGSVWATTVGTNVSVSGTLVTSSTTASSSVAFALGVATTTPSNTLSVVGDTYITRGLGVGIATTTTGALQITGPAQLAGVLSVTGAASVGGVLITTSSTASSSIGFALGVGTTTPQNTLSVTGDIYATRGLGVGTGYATTTAGAFQITGNALLGDASTDLAMFNGSLVFNNVGTTTILTGNANAWSIATSTANVPLVKYDTSNYRVGIGTTTPAKTLAVAGDAMLTNQSTSTLHLYSTSATAGGCIEFESPTGTFLRLYATTTGLAVFESGTCK